MPAQIGSLYVSLTLNASPYAAGLAQASAATTSAVGNIRRQAGLAEASVRNFTNTSSKGNFQPYAILAASRGFQSASERAELLRGSLLALTSVAGGFTAAISTNVIARYADTYTQLYNQIRTVTSGTADLIAVQNALVGVSERSRASLSATTQIYARTARASEAFGLSEEKVLRIVETVQKAFAIGGATTEEASGAALQLSQAIASNRFSGDEYRSVAENAPVLLGGIAKSLGVTIGQLRLMGQAGKLTAQEVTKGILEASAAIDQTFGRTVITLDQSLTQLDNQILLFVGRANQSYGATHLLAQGILEISKNLDAIVPTLATVGGLIAAVFLARNKAVLGGGVGALAGGLIGGAVAGPAGATVGTLAGGLLGFKGLQGSTVTDAEGNRRRVGFIQQIKDDSAAANAEVLRLTEAEKQLQIVAESAAAQLKSANEAAQNPLALAPKSLGSAYLRDLDKVAKINEQRLAQNAKLQSSYVALNEVTSTMSARAVKLSEAQFNAEEKLAGTVERASQLSNDRVGAITRETAALGMQVTTVGKLSTAVDATKNRITIDKEIAKTEADIGKQNESIAKRQIAIDTELSAADQKAAAQRIALQQKIQEQTKLATALYKEEQAAFEAAGRSRATAAGAGAQVGAANIGAATAANHSAAVALSEVEAASLRAAAATKPLAIGLQFAGRQWQNFLGLFGGGYGLALTGVVVALGAVGAAAEANAARIAKVDSIVQEELQRLGQGVDVNAGQVQDLAASKAAALADNIKLVKDRIAELQKGIAATNFDNSNSFDFGGGFLKSQLQFLQPQVQQLRDLAKEYQDTGEDTSVFQTKLTLLTDTVQNDAFTRFSAQVLEAAKSLRKQKDAAKSLDDQLHELQITAGEIKGGNVDAGLINPVADVAGLQQFNAGKLQSLQLTKEETTLLKARNEYLKGAKAAGIDINGSGRAEILQLADAYARQKVAADEALKANTKYDQELAKLQETVKGLAFDAATTNLTKFDKKVAAVASSSGLTDQAISALFTDLNRAGSGDFSFGGLAAVSAQLAKLYGLAREDDELSRTIKLSEDLRSALQDLGKQTEQVLFDNATKGLNGFDKEVIDAAQKIGLVDAAMKAFQKDLAEGDLGLNGFNKVLAQLDALAKGYSALNAAQNKADREAQLNVRTVDNSPFGRGAFNGTARLDPNNPGHNTDGSIHVIDVATEKLFPNAGTGPGAAPTPAPLPAAPLTVVDVAKGVSDGSAKVADGITEVKASVDTGTTTLGTGLTALNTSVTTTAATTQAVLGTINGSLVDLKNPLNSIVAAIQSLSGTISSAIASAVAAATPTASTGVTPSGGGGGGFAKGGWGGGWTSGPGSSMSDGINAKLSPGEFVVNARAANKNRSALNAINGGNYSMGGAIKNNYATGGEVYGDGTGENFTYQDNKGGVQFRTATIYTDGSDIKISPQTTPSLFSPATNPHYYDFLSAAVPWNPDPGLAAYDQSHPGGGEFWERLEQATRFYSMPNLTTSQGFAYAFGWAQAHDEGITALPTAEQAIGGTSINGFPERFQRQFPGFDSGGGIFGKDKDVVHLRKNNDEAAMIFTTAQMNLIGRAVDAGNILDRLGADNENANRGARATGGNVVSMGDIHFHIPGAGNPEATARAVESRLADYVTKLQNGRVS